MISDDRIFALMSIWYHWVLPIMVLAAAFCFAMAGLQKIKESKTRKKGS